MLPGIAFYSLLGDLGSNLGGRLAGGVYVTVERIERTYTWLSHGGVTMVRSNAFARPTAVLAALVRLLPPCLIVASLLGMVFSDLARAADGEVVVGQINGTITPVMANY